MESLFIGIGDVGSLADLATFVVAVVVLQQVRSQQDQGHAVITALAECVPRVDADLVRADLDVPRRESEAYVRDVRADGGSVLDDFPAEAEPDGEVGAPHHFYIGLLGAWFAFQYVWPYYPVTGAVGALVGVAVVLDDVLSHAFGIPTPFDELWKRAIYPALPSQR